MNIITREALDSEGNAKTITYKFRLEETILHVSEITVDENNQEVEIPKIHQPWHPKPDGSRSDWIDEADARNWVESIKHTI